MQTDTTWAEDRITALRRLWAEGHSVAEIGRRIGVSKNAVAGKAHRLKLPSRGSPIRVGARAGEKPSAAPRRLGVRPVRTLPVLAEPPTLAAVACRAPAPRPAPLPAPRHGPIRQCAWPIGEPRRPGFRFCGDATIPGRPYCAEHAGRAYQLRSAAS